jgi:flavin reductase (DIM6/NTAB) family NADH-FMN oxidoreductase RutF
MATKEGPVPPFPVGADPDDYDRLRRRLLWKMPSGLYVAGSRSADNTTRNLMTLNWATQLSFDPKWIGIGVEREALTHSLITAAGVFSLCLIDREDRAIVRKFTKPVDVDVEAHTLAGFPYFDGPVSGAPVLAQVSVNHSPEVEALAVAARSSGCHLRHGQHSSGQGVVTRRVRAA